MTAQGFNTAKRKAQQNNDLFFYISFLLQCENEIKSLRSKLLLNNGNYDENEEKGEDGLDSDENDDDDDDDEPTLMSRSKHCAKQVYL